LREVGPRWALDLAQAAPPVLSALFPIAVDQVWLEVGFGGGEHLLWQAARNPSVGFIGCEPFQDGVVRVLDAIEARGAENVRIYADDGRPLLRWLPANSIGRTFILFPDPWPKKRQRKRRLVNAQLLDLLARLMMAGAELRIATDIGDYVRTILLAVRQQGAFCWEVQGVAGWRDRPADWPETRYEGKAIAAGRRCYYLSLRRR
jgi:tRNA (guanine-N7-)-methyltransferase